MLKRNSVHGHHTIPILFFVLNNIHGIKAQNNSTCNPLNCTALCNPACKDEDVCMLTTMKQCGVCPPSVCLNRVVMGLPPLAKTSKPKSSNAGMIGGIVGGLIGLGVLVFLGVWLYLRRGKKKGQLPFAFTNRSGISHLGQYPTSPPPTPHSTMAAALGHQRQRSRESDMSLRDRSIPSSPLGLNSNNTPLYINTNTNNVTSPTTLTATPAVPEEFEERIALQNKRISHILNSSSRISHQNSPRLSHQSSPRLHHQSSPRLSQHQGTFSQIQSNFDNGGPSNRNSAMTFTTDEDSEYDYDDQIIVAKKIRAVPAAQAVQVNRAKVQIMRVNSVRSTTGGLNRSDSVRTIISPLVEDDLADQFPPTPNNRIEDPFQDKK